MNNNTYQQQIQKRLQQQQQLAKYRQSQKNYGLGDYAKAGMAGRSSVGAIGKNMMNSKNANVANIGSKLYNGSGQGIVDGVKKNAYDTISNGVTSIGNKLGLGANAGTTALNNATSSAIGGAANSAITGAGANTGAIGSAIGSEVAGTGATAGTSALQGALAAETAAGATTAGAAGAGTGAAGAAGAGALAPALGALGPVGAVAAAGYMIYNMIKSAQDKKANEEMQAGLSLNNQAVAENKSNAMQNITQGSQLADELNQKLGFGQENMSPDQIKEQIYGQMYSGMPNVPQNEISSLGQTNIPSTNETLNTAQSDMSFDNLVNVSDDELEKELMRRGL